ncbi:flavin reductase family protein [Siculibacillus lacustris]|uniref:flavin reductase family protein n=1 Tax=Siculibacillus lacustris TaxID=1549641 RepID=UPI001D1916BE|nr:flavin reductase family protein [Siculibacillus lacustris]
MQDDDPTDRREASIGFDFGRLSGRERYKLLIGAIVPRPIALVTTVDRDGRVNAAPFSFFNCLSADPAILAIGVERRGDGRPKDTGRNIRDTQAFTVNIVSRALLDAMNTCAVAFEPEVDETVAAGLALRPGVAVPCPSLLASPASFECRHHVTLAIGGSRDIVLGEVVHAHIHRDCVNERLHVDPVVLDAIGRMGGDLYASTRDLFELPTPSVAEWQAATRR